MAGIYLHIPFCKHACNYCDFHFSTSMKMKVDFVQAIIQEIELRKDVFANEFISSVYFGGGTPSLLSKEELDTIFEKLYKSFTIDADAEITLEANPDDLTFEKIQQLKDSPVNRLSIGVQSFRDEDLKYMNRAHTAIEALNSIKMAQDASFQNITIDLIYGTPGMSNEGWKHYLRKSFALNIPHISCYALTVEEKTPLYYQILKKNIGPVDEQQSADQFKILMDEMLRYGYEQYEISNF
ncbi:MAG: radical SAM family heme chaperone HemW [Flavobacteriales bacterium]|nr:radical SAM family heme chaperone HemW [Flavobacteriales bacterium]